MKEQMYPKIIKAGRYLISLGYLRKWDNGLIILVQKIHTASARIAIVSLLVSRNENQSA